MTRLIESFEATQTLTSGVDPSPIALPDQGVNDDEAVKIVFSAADDVVDVSNGELDTTGIVIPAATVVELGPFRLASIREDGLWVHFTTGTTVQVVVERLG